ncbi:MAG: Hsp20/alpha crystallin family protein [Clostridia bacterium]|nr:Hsp20/alpha crystallin family protein [Clostridia bacterium]
MNIDKNNFDRAVDNFDENSSLRFFSLPSSPRVDVYQTKSDIIIKAEIPDTLRENISVYASDYSIRLTWQSGSGTLHKDNYIYRTGRFSNSFTRTIPLPIKIISNKTRIEYKDGILSITVPKTEPVMAKD